MAGIQALVDQHSGGRQGNPNTTYYSLAAVASNVCDSSASNLPSSCIFYKVTKGDNDVNCGGSVECYGSTTTTSGGRHPTTVQELDGALSTSSSAYSPAYSTCSSAYPVCPTGVETTSGWSFATGIGSVNAYNLVMHW
jgi:hypothetical protein